MKKVHLLLFLAILQFGIPMSAQENVQGILEIEIAVDKGNKGQMVVGLYNSPSQWLQKVYQGAIAPIEHGVAKVVFEGLPQGAYAISVFHDADGDGRLKTFLGIPTERTGASNNAPARFGPPRWEDAKFEVGQAKVVQRIAL